MTTYRVLVACGSGIATSTHVATVLKSRLADRGISVETTQCRIQDIKSYLSGMDAVVTTTSLAVDVGVPVLNGVPLLIGVGSEQVIDELAAVLTKG